MRTYVLETWKQKQHNIKKSLTDFYCNNGQDEKKNKQNKIKGEGSVLVN